MAALSTKFILANITKLNFDNVLYSSKHNIIYAYIRIIILCLILYFFKIIEDEDKKIFISISHADFSKDNDSK